MNDFPRPPTGHLEHGPDGRRLVLRRSFAAPMEDVWASLTEPARLARWYGRVTGDLRSGGVVEIAMTAEDGAPTEPAVIRECDPPRFLAVELGVGDPASVWRVSLELEETSGTTSMTLTHVLSDDLAAGDIGPGWEYYADRLAASREERDLPSWDGDGYPTGFGDHYSRYG